MRSVTIRPAPWWIRCLWHLPVWVPGIRFEALRYGQTIVVGAFVCNHGIWIGPDPRD